MATFEETLGEAQARCNGKLYLRDRQDFFRTLYPFTTELISSYIDFFNLADGPLLTVGSSCDQVINAALKGAREITLIDTDPYTRFYFYFKWAALEVLARDEFYKFLCHQNYPVEFQRNHNPLRKEFYVRVKLAMEELDPYSCRFWDLLYMTYTPKQIRESIFNRDEHGPEIISKCNPYLARDTYKSVSEILKGVHVTFLNKNLLSARIKGSFKNIWLSNVGVDLTAEERRTIFDKFYSLLEPEGQLLLAYIYGPSNTNAANEMSYLNILKAEFSDYPIQEIRFRGINGFRNDRDQDDCALIIRKHWKTMLF